MSNKDIFQVSFNARNFFFQQNFLNEHNIMSYVIPDVWLYYCGEKRDQSFVYENFNKPFLRSIL